MEEKLGNLPSSLCLPPHNQGGVTLPDVQPRRDALVPGIQEVKEASWKDINWKNPSLASPSPGLSPAEFAHCLKSTTHQLFMFLTPSSGASAI